MHVLFVGRQHLVGQVGVDVNAGVVGPVPRPRAAQQVQFAKDPEEVGDSLLVGVSGQEGHDDELQSEQHEQIAPLRVQRGHDESGSLREVRKTKTR